MGKENKTVVSTFAVRLDDYYKTGLAIAAEKKADMGKSDTTKSTMIREGLDRFFESFGITAEDIQEELRKQKQSS